MSTEGPQVPAPRRPIVGGSRYARAVALVGLAILVYITINALGTKQPGSRGLPAGAKLPAFAAPLVRSSYKDEAEANIAIPGHLNRQTGLVAACDVHSAGAFNVCAASAQHPLVLAFFTATGRCVRVLDTMERARIAFPGVSFAAISIVGDRGELRRLVRAHGWGFPVAYDHDGAVTNLYRVAVCPTVTFAYTGGRVMKTVLGDAVAKPAVLAADLRRLLAGPPARPPASAGTRTG